MPADTSSAPEVLGCPAWCRRGDSPHADHESAPLGPYYTGAGLMHASGVETRAGDLYARLILEGSRFDVGISVARSIAAALTNLADRLEGLT